MASPEEMKAFMDEFFNGPEFEGMIEEGFKECDTDGDGSVDKSELVKAMTELKNVVGEDGVKLPEINEEAVNEVMAEFDKNGDGKLQKSEFGAFTKAVMEYAIG